jgi:hypothetical protein
MNNQHKPEAVSKVTGMPTTFAEEWRRAVLGNQQARLGLVQRLGKQNGRYTV